MWRRELFKNLKWNSGQSDQEWRRDAVSRGHVRSKTKLLRPDKWFVVISIRIFANLPSAEGAESIAPSDRAAGQWRKGTHWGARRRLAIVKGKPQSESGSLA